VADADVEDPPAAAAPAQSGAPVFGPRESYEDARRVEVLTAEARNPPRA